MISFFLSSVFFFSVVSPQESIKTMEDVIRPALKESTDWASDVALKLVALQAFYVVIVSKLLK
jgi:hypothetical protein